MGDPDEISPDYSKFQSSTQNLFVGKVLENSGNYNVNIDVRNKFFKGDMIEVLSRKGPAKQDKINDIIDISGQSLSFAPQGSKVTISLSTECSTNDLIRKVGLATDPHKQAQKVRSQRSEEKKTNIEHRTSNIEF